MIENPDKSVKIGAAEKFSDVFPRGKVLYSDLPNFNDTECQCWLHWHAKGFCKSATCKHAESHKMMNVETKKKFLAFLDKQRAHAKKS